MRLTLLIRLSRDDHGQLSVAPDLRLAEEAVALHAAGHQVRLVTARPAGTLHEWATALARSRPATVLVRGDDDLVEVVRCALADLGVATEGRPGSPQAAPAAMGDDGRGLSIWRSPFLPVEYATDLGVRTLNRDGSLRSTTMVTDDLRHLARHGLRSVSIPLVGCTLRDSALVHPTHAERLARALDAGDIASAELTVRPRVRVVDLDAGLAGAVAALPAAGVDLIVDAEVDTPSSLRTALLRCAHRGLHASALLTLPPRRSPSVTATAARVAALLQVAPDAHLAIDDTRLRALAAAGGLRGCPPHSATAVRLRELRRVSLRVVERAVTRHYADAPLNGGVHHLWWLWREDPRRYADWIAAVISHGGAVLGPDGTQGSTAAHVPVLGASLPRGYADGGDDPGPRALFATTDLDALRHDVARCLAGADVPRRLLLMTELAHRCFLGLAGCASARGQQWVVDTDGSVRTRPGGPSLGWVGDGLAALRSRAREVTIDGCACGLGPADPVDHDVRASVPLVTAAARTLQALGGDARTAAVRISGLGGGITHCDQVTRPSVDVHRGLLLRIDGDFLLHRRDAEGTRVLRLSPAQAVLLETASEHEGDHDALVAVAAARLGVDKTTARDALTRATHVLPDLALHAEVDAPAPAMR